MFAATTSVSHAVLAKPACAVKKSTPQRLRVVASSSDAASDAATTFLSRRRVFAGAAVLAAFASGASPALAKDGKNGVYFIEPRGDKAVVGREVTVKMGVKGYELAPASAGLQEGTGHHHLIVDGPAFIEKGQEIPFDETHLHFGKAQKEGVVNLTPGEHTLTLQFADAKHRSFGKKFAKQITVVVE